MIFFLSLVLAASPPALKLGWEANGASSQTVLVRDGEGTSLVTLLTTGGVRSLVRVDAITGVIAWQSDVVPGVGWGSLTVAGDQVLLQGVTISSGVGHVAVVALIDGQRIWERPVREGDTLRAGLHGGFVIEGACDAMVLSLRGGVVATYAGVSLALDDGTPLCAARPQVWGEVADRVIIAVPDAKGWRLEAVGQGAGWSQSLGGLSDAPEVDWRTGMMWFSTPTGLALRRYNLASGKLAWSSTLPTSTCGFTARPVDGPSGAPTVLVQSCDLLTAIDPHNGEVAWQTSNGMGQAIVEGERFGLPEWVQPAQQPQALRWIDGNGRPTGQATVPPQSWAVPMPEGVLVRSADRVFLVDRAGVERWSVPIVNPRWALMGDLLVIAAELGQQRLVVQAATGAILGTFDSGEAIGSVTVPGTQSGRLIYVQGATLRALKINVRP